MLSTNHTIVEEATVAMVAAGSKYPECAPFHPSIAYPEYRWETAGTENRVYDGVRELLRLLRLDLDHYGSSAWNPLGEIVRPGDRVVVKPNLLWHSHKFRPDEWKQVITHGSVVRAVVDYVLIALRGTGQIWIADGPQLDANFEKIIERTGLSAICEFYKRVTAIPVRLLDLRDAYEDVRGEVLYAVKPLPGDPFGATVVDLADRSCFVEHRGSGRYYGATYDEAETNYHHSGGRHEYRLSKTVASADVFINIPKMKTHKKVGVTLCLKNLVGINTGRNWLPHHTSGDPLAGGDQFPRSTVMTKSERAGIGLLQRLTMRQKGFAPVFRLAKKVARPIFGHTQETIRSGNWHGNDTCWRMVQDINRALMYSDGEQFPTNTRKRFFAVVDGIVAGDHNGPEAPEPFEAGALVAGLNPVAVDCATAALMGFDPMRIPMLREAFAPSLLPLADFAYQDIRVASSNPDWNREILSFGPEIGFSMCPHFGWKAQIEYAPGLAKTV